MFRSQDWRDRRNLLNQGISFSPMQYTIANYSTEKTELNAAFAQEDILNKLHSIPDPLKKNLADSVLNVEDLNNKNKAMPPDLTDYFYEETMRAEGVDDPPDVDKTDTYPSLTGIASFFTNFFGAISGAMFQRRAKSPVHYYDCFDQDSDCRERPPPSWQPSKFDDQNKNGALEFSSDQPNVNMNKNCRDAVSQCEGKINAVRNLLINKTVPYKPKYRRRPRKLFVEPRAVEENFEDACTPEDFVSLANEEYVEYFSVKRVHDQELCEIDAPKMKTEIGPIQETEIVKVVTDIDEKTVPNVNVIEEKIISSPDVIKEEIPSTELQETNLSNSVETLEIQKEINPEIIVSCEDKMAKLKTLLQEKHKKNTKTVQDLTDSAPETVKEHERPKTPSRDIPMAKVKDKRFKNPNRTSTDKRKRSKLRKSIQDDILFAQEIDSSDLSLNNSPIPVSNIQPSLETKETEETDYFDEIKGRFSSSDGEDSFQIVFSDSPKLARTRKPSDCDSEDSFIVFEESPDSCYTSNDVFGDETESDTDSDSDVSDSGVSEVCKLSHTFSRTVSDLTDDSLYEDVRNCDNDEVDCAVRSLEEVPEVPEVLEEVEEKKPGLLIDEAKKLQRKGQPAKVVSFSSKPPKVHVMRVWAFAAKQARAGHWERHALDRERFKRRIADVDMAVSWVLKPQHRSRVMFQRFMPWWNAQKRKELAEKKLREAEEKLRREEEEKRREEEEKRAAEELKALQVTDNIDIEGDKVNSSDASIDVINTVNGELSIDKEINIDDGNIKDTSREMNETQTDENKELVNVSDKLAGLALNSNVAKEIV